MANLVLDWLSESGFLAIANLGHSLVLANLGMAYGFSESGDTHLANLVLVYSESGPD